MAAFSADCGSLSFSSKDLYKVLFEAAMLSLEVSKLLLTTLNALITSLETFRARMAVSTRYITLIIFCLGSLGNAMVFKFYFGFQIWITIIYLSLIHIS